MNNYVWNDIKKRAEKMETFRQRLENSNIILFGARMNGNYAYKKIKKEYAVYAFSDNNQELWGGTYQGISVISPEKLKEITNCFVVITTSEFYYLPIKKQLNDMGIDGITYMEYVLIHHYDKLEMVYSRLLEDEYSKIFTDGALDKVLKESLLNQMEIYILYQVVMKNGIFLM